VANGHRRALNVAHTPCAVPARIACLVPSITELLFALELGEHLVARTGFCIHPAPEVLAVPKVGGTKDVNLAKLLALAPSHVILNIDENTNTFVSALRAAAPHITLVVTHPCAPEDNVRLYALLGFIFNREPHAQQLIAAFERNLNAAHETVAALPRERVLYLIWRAPWMTVGPHTYVARTLAHVGWDCVSIETLDRYPTLFDNNHAWQGADRVLLSSEPFAFRESHVTEIQRLAPRAQVHLIDGELASWYGSRAIASVLALAHYKFQLFHAAPVTARSICAN
jgi:Periplasmic binding protein